jgi:hypothetical protein
MALQFEARKVALKQDRTGYVLTLSLHPDEIPEELLRDFVGARYACALVRIQDDESPTMYNNRVQKAGMLCREENFQEFIAQRLVGHSVDEHQAADALCKQCGIASRSELNGNTRAQEVFDAIVIDYENWSRTDPDPF